MDFNLPYDRNNYIRFFRSQFLPEDFEQSGEPIPLTFSPQYTQQVTKIGESRSFDLNVYEVEHTSENDPRVSLSKESFRLLAKYGQKRALVLFISHTSPNYRLSLVTIDLKWEEGKRPTREYSNPRRFSFFLGPDAKVHTPKEYLIKPGRVKDLEDLKTRFSIEVVNKDFYTQIAILFTKFTGGQRKIGSKSLDIKKGILAFPSPDETKRKEFAVRLIGRLVFCWFLKKKESTQGKALLPEDLLCSNAIGKTKGLGGYYHSILEPLFFEVLNTPMDERPKSFSSEPWSIMPFLNGGLFTPHKDDYYELSDPGVSKYLNTLKVPDKWLQDLLGIFETYNFTIDENTPVDIELSIEPEMLGRIFENLLAEINPETGETARKATGSYYTPRPIVEYMVDESLKQYLLTKTKVPEDKLAVLLSYTDDELELSEVEKESVLDALDAIKIIDPACGSGAFPMGILQKILLMLQKIDPDSQKWLSRILAKIENAAVRKELESKLKNAGLNYIHKLGVIQSSIYGVDIQPIAVDISKLRCFLSLIVDESIDDAKKNRGIEPLPNLEFKFVCANTLIGLPEKEISASRKKDTKGQSLMFEASDQIKELKELREKYLRSYGKEKKQIEERFRKTQGKMFEHALNWGGKETQTLKLSQWNPFSDEPCHWFDPEWMFGVPEGFDIVIANPPYIASYGRQAKKFRKEEISLFIENYKTFSKVSNRKNISINTVMVFLEKGLDLLRNDKILSYIVDQAILNVDVYSFSREYILENAHIREIVSDLKFPQVIAEACILFLHKKQLQGNYSFSWKKKEVDSNPKSVEVMDVIDNNYTFCLSYFDKIIKKIENESKPLSQVASTSTGMQIIPEYFLSDEDGLIRKPMWHKAVFSKNIERYKITWPIKNQKGKYITYDVDLQANVRRELQRKLDKGEKCRKPETLSIGSKAKECRFFAPKVILSQTVSNAEGKIRLQAALDGEVGYYGNVSIHLIGHDDLNYLKLLMAIINSSLISFYAVEKKLILGSEGGSRKTPQIRKGSIDKIPIRKISPAIQERLLFLVDKILVSKKVNPDTNTKHLEKQIDQMVYKLYGLTKEETAIVERSRS